MPRRDLRTKKLKTPRLYADENIPRQTVNYLRSKKIPLIHSVADKNFSGREDEFHFKIKLDRMTILEENMIGKITSQIIQW